MTTIQYNHNNDNPFLSIDKDEDKLEANKLTVEHIGLISLSYLLFSITYLL